jgi:DNA-binding transcriptional LysR family regulator
VELRHLEHFVAVAEERHFTAAAARLHIAQSGLSASVRALEHELGAELFSRTTRRVELTDAGRALLAEARRTLAAADAARDAVAAVRGLMRGTLAVGTEQCMGAIDPVSLLSDFRLAHPGVEVRLVQSGSAQLLDQLRAGTLDVAFVPVVEPPDGIAFSALSSEPMVLLCRADHRLATASEINLAQLADQTFVEFQSGWGARQLTDAAFAGARVTRQVAMEVNDVHTLLDLVGRGLGAALVPRPVARKEQAGGLCAVPVTAAPTWRVGVALPAGREPSPATRGFLARVNAPEHPVTEVLPASEVPRARDASDAPLNGVIAH